MTSDTTKLSNHERNLGRKRRLGRFAALIGGYASTIFISAIVGVGIIPVILSQSGDAGWAAIAVGQSIGSIAAVVIALGWTITGPALVARASTAGRGQLVANSVVARVWLSILVLPVMGLAAHISSPEYKLPAAFAALNIASVGLGFAWYFVGISSPRALLVFDTIPRAFGTILGGFVLWMTGSLVAFALVQVALSGAAIYLSIAFATRSLAHRPRWYWSLGWSLRQLRNQVFPSTTALASAIYNALPTLAVAWLSPAGIGSFALAERIGRYVTLSVTPMHSWMQGWVPAAQTLSSTKRRIRSVIIVSSIGGLTAGAGLILTGPWLSALLSGGKVSVGFDLMTGIAVAIGMTTISRCTGAACLVALGATKPVAFSTFAGAISCIIVLFVFVPPLGAVGAGYAMATAETTVVVYQSFVLWRRLRSNTIRGRRRAEGANASKTTSA